MVKPPLNSSYLIARQSTEMPCMEPSEGITLTPHSEKKLPHSSRGMTGLINSEQFLSDSTSASLNYRLLKNNSAISYGPDGEIIVDKTLSFSQYNKYACEVFGFKAIEELPSGYTFREYFFLINHHLNNRIEKKKEVDRFLENLPKIVTSLVKASLQQSNMREYFTLQVLKTVIQLQRERINNKPLQWFKSNQADDEAVINKVLGEYCGYSDLIEVGKALLSNLEQFSEVSYSLLGDLAKQIQYIVMDLDDGGNDEYMKHIIEGIYAKMRNCYKNMMRYSVMLPQSTTLSMICGRGEETTTYYGQSLAISLVTKGGSDTNIIKNYSSPSVIPYSILGGSEDNLASYSLPSVSSPTLSGGKESRVISDSESSEMPLMIIGGGEGSVTTNYSDSES